jgi:hypothetical protein
MVMKKGRLDAAMVVILIWLCMEMNYKSSRNWGGVMHSCLVVCMMHGNRLCGGRAG